MKNNDSYLGRSYIKIVLFLKIILYSYKILFRFVVLLIKRKRLNLYFFKADTHYCVHGTFNQLTWKVDNASFIILENSSKLYFGSGEHIFKVDHGKTEFNIICYGVGNKIRAATTIKVAQFRVNEFGIVPRRRQNKIMDFDELDFAQFRTQTQLNLFKPMIKKVRIKTGIQELESLEHAELKQKLGELYKVNSKEDIPDIKRTITNQS